jgi:hypothetical protein
MKLPFFGKRAPDTPAGARPISDVLVSQSAYESSDPAVIVAQNVDFVNRLLNQGAYLPDEVPLNARRAYHADYYLAQVSNGGHGQFVGNSRWAPIVIKDIADALAAMGAAPFDAIFRDLCRLIGSDSERAEAIANSGGFGEPDPAIADLDKRYFAQDAYQIITPANARWLRSLPELRVVGDADYPAEIQALCEANPERPARLSAREREGIAARLLDPVRVASRLLCMKVNCMPVAGFGGGDPSAVAPDGRQGVGWHIQSRAGRQVVFVFDDVSYLCESYLADGRKVTPELMAERRRHLEAGDMEIFAAFSKIVYKEVTQIPSVHVAAAIEAAKKMPVVRFAEMLCARMKPAGTLRDVYAAILHQSGQFLWLMETTDSGGLFGFNGGELVLYDPAMKPLAKVSRDEVNAALKAGY